MFGLIWKKTRNKEMHEISVAVLDLHGKSLNFVKLVLDLLRLFERKQLSRKKFGKELFLICNDFQTKLNSINGRKNNASRG